MEYSYRFRIYPTEEQKELMTKTFGSCRYVFNYFLNRRKTTYNETGRGLSFKECCRELTSLKKELPWLKEVDSTALQAAVQNLDKAYTNFFRGLKTGCRVGYPQFKAKKRDIPSFKAKNNRGAVAITGKSIRLPKIGHVDCRISKQVKGEILSATVQQAKSGKYYVAINRKNVDLPSTPATGSVVGIDLGLKDLAITSDGEKFDNPHTYAKNQKKLARLQRQLSRKTKGSHNREKAKLRVARLHEKIANQRNDALHKMTTKLVRENDVICMENLSVKNLVKNRKLAKSIMDASWGEVRRQLAYKTVWYGKELVIVDRFFPSSQICHCCGAKNPATKDLGIRYWVCPNCRAAHDRDINAAENILTEGLGKIGLPAQRAISW